MERVVTYLIIYALSNMAAFCNIWWNNTTKKIGLSLFNSNERREDSNLFFCLPLRLMSRLTEKFSSIASSQLLVSDREQRLWKNTYFGNI